MSKYNLTDIAEGMGYKEFKDAREKSREEKHPEKKTIDNIRALMAKEKEMNEGASVIKVKNKGNYITMGGSYGGGDKRERYDVYLNGEAVYEFSNTAFRQKSIEQIAKILLDTPSLDISQEDSIRMATEMSKYLTPPNKINKMNEERIEKELANRIEGLEDIEEGYEDTKGKALYPILKAGANATGDEVEMYVKSLAKDIELNGKEQYKDFTSDDFVEDFKNYIADKSLEEHFKRFM